MATLLRVKLRWSGFIGGPGYSIFHMRDFSGGEPDQAQADAAVARIGDFANFARTHCPQAVQLQVQSDVEVIEETNGQLQSIFNVTTGGPQQGQAPTDEAYSAASGAVITWRTPGVRNGRRVRGRTFLVPLSSIAYQSDGTLSPAAISNLNSAAGNLVNGTGTPDMGVWARPSAKGATDGIWYAAGSYSINDKVAILRSRRD